jgi:eukaryotic-like serine/threonine-protein kinase
MFDNPPPEPTSPAEAGTPTTVTNVSGGVNLDAQRDVNIGGDVVGRDKTIIQTITNIFQGDTARRDQRNRRNMLELVKNTWVEGVLEKSLYHEMMIDLGLEERPGEVQRPWDMTLQMPDHENRPLPPGTKIMQVFDDLNRALLILGEPGSGKTTMLLELARDTIARAEQDPMQPIPVVFNLSSWSDPKQTIADWLVQELNDKYDVHKKIVRPWIDNDDLLLLLDGLDEVKAKQREACVKAINDFRNEHGQMQLVVCSRVADYKALTTKLKLRGAVLLQPLTSWQIDEYLVRAASELAAVRETLQHDADLQELAQSPLMLSVMSLAYAGWSIDDLKSESGDPTRRRKHLFDAYVSKMFTRTARTQHEIYPREQTVHWLAYLAQKMTEHAQAVFLIERMQPDWLPTRKHRSLYGLCVMLSVVLPVGLFVGLGGGLPVALSGYSAVGWAFGLTVGLAFGMAVWLAIRGLASGLVGRLLVGLAFGSAFWLAFAQVFGPEIGRPVGLAVGLVAGIAFVLVSRRPTGWSAADRDQIESVETLSWSWSKAASGLASGLITGFLFGLIVWLAVGRYYGLAFGLVFGLALGVGFGLAAGLFRGLTGVEMETSTAPNQGILRSAQNALAIGLSVCMGVGLFIGLASGLAWSLAFGPDTGLTVGLVTGMSIGLGFGIAVGMFFGGLTCIKHIVLRLFLYHNGLIPWSYAHFLDYATDCIFLRKVGGSYIFIHRMLMEYFAALETSTAKGLEGFDVRVSTA